MLRRTGEWRQATEDVNRCLERDPRDGATLYTAACVAALATSRSVAPARSRQPSISWNGPKCAMRTSPRRRPIRPGADSRSPEVQAACRATGTLANDVVSMPRLDDSHHRVASVSFLTTRVRLRTRSFAVPLTSSYGQTRRKAGTQSHGAGSPHSPSRLARLPKD